MTVVDTSYLVALLDVRDRFHQQARAKPRHGDRLLIPWETWIEFCQVFMRNQPAETTRTLTAKVAAGPFEIHKVLEPDDVARLASSAESMQDRLKKAGHGPLTLFDIVVLAIAARFKEKVYTFDRAMEHAVREGLFPGARLG